MDFIEREGVVADYFKELYETKNPVGFFSSMMRDLLSVETEKTHFMLIARLLKLYGRKSLFHAVIDIAESNDLEISKFPYGLLAYLCKRNSGITDENKYTDHPSLEGFIQKVNKELEKARR